MTTDNLPKNETRLIALIDELAEHFGIRSLEEIIKAKKAGKNKRRRSLSEKDYMILDCLYCLDFLTTEQLKSLFFPNHSYTGSWYHFDKLSRHGLITNDSYYWGRDERWAMWKVTEFGLETLADYKGYKYRRELGEPRQIKTTQLRHDYYLNQIYVDLAGYRGGIKNLVDEIDWHPHRRRYLAYDPKRKYDRRRRGYFNFYSYIFPDAVLESLGSDYKVYLEFDMGTKAISDIVRDLKSYAHYFRESKEQCRHMIYLIYAVPNKYRKESVQNAAEEAGGESAFANFRSYLHGPELLDKLSLIIDGPQENTDEQSKT